MRALTRRQFVARSSSLGIGAVACGLASLISCVPGAAPPAPRPPAQPARIGFLASGPPPPGSSANTDAFLDGLQELGYVDGRDYVMDYGWVRTGEDSFADAAARLVRAPVDVIVAIALAATKAAMDATTTIPIVMVVGNDPVAAGIVPSMSRPGGRVTGVTSRSGQLAGKRLELLKELIPTMARVGVLAEAEDPNGLADFREIELAARQLRLEPHYLKLSTPDEIDQAFTLAAGIGVDSLIVVAGDIIFQYRRRIVGLAASHGLPAIYSSGRYTEVGGLMAYGPNTPQILHRAATYVDRILKGTPPGDLPIEQPNRFDLIINLQAARALGISVPPLLLSDATEVIE